MLLGCLTVAACAVALPPMPIDVPPASADTSFFGARSMNEQLRALDALGVEPGDARAALGRRLYFDNRLSRNGTVACATCHDVTYGFTDRRARAMGIGKQVGRRNAPTTLNAALLERQFWDGRAADVEEQAGMPIVNPIEMGFATEADAVARLAAIPEYAADFLAVYGRAPSYPDLRDAIGAFERTLIFLDAPFDRWRAGEAAAISASAARGFDLFSGRAGCSTCHPVSGERPLLTDHGYHNTVPGAYPPDAADQGRFEFTNDPADLGAFKTPSLRNVGITGPYLHDGSLPTLWQAVRHFDPAGALSAQDVEDLVAFLFSLTDLRLAAQNEETLIWQRSRAPTPPG
jgi:cytochrome c peroxidase